MSIREHYFNGNSELLLNKPQAGMLNDVNMDQ